MEVKRFITRPDIMAIYEKCGVTEEVLASITDAAVYSIAKAKMDGATPQAIEEPIEEPTEEPTEEPIEEEVIETPEVEEPVEESTEEPEIVVEETEE